MKKLKKEYFHNVILGFDVNNEINEYYKKVAMHFPLTDEHASIKFQETWHELLEKTNQKNDNFSIYHLSALGEEWTQFTKENPYFSSINEPIKNIDEFLDAITPKEITSFDIANIILEIEKNNNCTHLRLQKLLYLCFQNYLKKTNKFLFSDTNFEVWELGPVNPNIYNKYKKYEKQQIQNLQYELSNADLKIHSHQDNIEIMECIYEVINKYKNIKTSDIIKCLHSDLSAWNKTRNEGKKIIPINYIKDCEF